MSHQQIHISHVNMATQPIETPQFYGCYLLRSIPKPGSFYIGSTPDPVRRLRQHNGELTAGAYRTKREGTRPWEMCVLIHGFPSKVTALMFEHAWQHSYSTRHIKKEQRIVNTKTGGRSLPHKLGNARLLLQSQFFSRMHLKVHCFTKDTYKAWCDNRFGIAVGDSVLVDSVQETRRDEEVNAAHLAAFKAAYQSEDCAMLDKYGSVLTFGQLQCAMCTGSVDYANDDSFPLLALCARCDSVSHLSCAAEEHSNTELLPRRAPCAGCGAPSPWPQLVKRATRVRARFCSKE